VNAFHDPLPTRPALVDDVYDALNQRLMDNVIPPGGRVTIDVLARELGVSPTPVREALARLESDGLVVRQGLRDYLAAPMLTLSEVETMYDFRLLIEPWASGRAALVGDDRQRQRLSDEMADAPPRPGLADYEHLRAMTSHDIRFHDLIMELGPMSWRARACSGPTATCTCSGSRPAVLLRCRPRTPPWSSTPRS